MNSKDTLDAIGRLPAGKALCQKDTRGDLTSHSDTDLTTADREDASAGNRRTEGNGGAGLMQKMSRVWAMPSADTLTIKPIRELVKKYLHNAKVIVDPFARNCNLGTITNDMSVDTLAQYHLPANEFLEMLVKDGVQADGVIFDPPYSLRQVKEVYQSVGLETMPFEATHGWKREREAIAELTKVGGYVLSCGWNSQGMGMKRGFDLVEVMLVAHGKDHNDTICTVERKRADPQEALFV